MSDADESDPLIIAVVNDVLNVFNNDYFAFEQRERSFVEHRVVTELNRQEDDDDSFVV